MKKSILALTLLASSSAFAANIGIVDMGSVFQAIPQRQAIADSLQKEFAGRVAELQKLEKEGAAMMEKMKKDEAFMSAEQKTQTGRKLAEMQAQFNLKRQSFEEDNQRRQNEERTKLLQRIKTIVDGLAKTKKLDLIVEKGATLYVNDSLDLSKDVIAQMAKSK